MNFLKSSSGPWVACVTKEKPITKQARITLNMAARRTLHYQERFNYFQISLPSAGYRYIALVMACGAIDDTRGAIDDRPIMAHGS